MKKTVNLNGQQIEAMLFKTGKAKDNYIAKNPEYKVLFVKSGYYLVTK